MATPIPLSAFMLNKATSSPPDFRLAEAELFPETVAGPDAVSCTVAFPLLSVVFVIETATEQLSPGLRNRGSDILIITGSATFMVFSAEPNCLPL